MNNFEELQNQWKNQPNVETSDKEFSKLLTGIKGIENKQKLSNAVLTLTIIVLVGFIIYVAGYNNATFMLGISIMIISLLIRILIEIASIKTIKKLNYLDNPSSFKGALLKYYKRRKGIHYVITPLILITYAIGFIILLPLFKENLSYGFYVYILCSSIVLLIFFSFFIARHAKRELLKLRELKANS